MHGKKENSKKKKTNLLLVSLFLCSCAQEPPMTGAKLGGAFSTRSLSSRLLRWLFGFLLPSWFALWFIFSHRATFRNSLLPGGVFHPLLLSFPPWEAPWLFPRASPNISSPSWHNSPCSDVPMAGVSQGDAKYSQST